MTSKPFKIGLIHSCQTLVATIDGIRSTTEDIYQLSCEGLENAIPVGKKMETEGIEVIISRQGTARMLRKTLSIPVISIPLSTMNILNALKSATSFGRKILLPCLESRIEELEFIQDLLGIDLILGTYSDAVSLKTLVRQAKTQGCQVVVGGGIAVDYANIFGMKGLEIETSKETILTSIESARSAALTNRQEREKSAKYRCIIESVQEGIITFDSEGLISTVNQMACKYLNSRQSDLMKHPIGRLLPQIPLRKLLENKTPIYEELQRIGDKLFIFNYIPIVTDDELVGVVTTFTNAKDLERAENRIRKTYTRGMKAKYYLSDLKYRSREMRQTVEKAARFSKTDGTILITGETGTGKELFAQGIHNASARSRQPFVSINCAALPEQLLESELFGYEEGAFTGSKKGGKPGLFEMAHNGTILLDEISATSQNVQSHLLRVIEEREVMRIGGNRLIPIDVRIIANANLELVEAAMKGEFREDLFFRLNVLPIRIPPLRDRREDLELLANEFIADISRAYGLPPLSLPKEVHRFLGDYSWPGNVRQLRHFMEQLVLISNGEFAQSVFGDLYEELIRFDLKPEALPPEAPNPTMSAASATTVSREDHATPLSHGGAVLNRIDEDQEKVLIQKALKDNRYHRGKTSRKLGICRATLWKKMKKYNL